MAEFIQQQSKANRRTVGRLSLAVLAMFAFGYALVPLYDILCEITGLNGKTNEEAVARETIAKDAIDTSRTVTVEFMASVNSYAPWKFAPSVAKMEVHPGQFYHTSYIANSLSDAALVGQAVPSVSPSSAARYFQKIECFCFNQQAFNGKESKDMPLTFRIDPKLSEDIEQITLSYTFFQIDPES